MRKLFLALLAIVLVVPAAEAAKKKAAIPPPPPRPVQPIAYPLAVIPPFLVFYDLYRRVNCLNPPDPLGLGGPGFDGKPVDPAKGNVMIPCWQRQIAKKSK